MDKLEKNGIVQTVITKKQRRREIDKNNKKLVQALQEAKMINNVGKSMSKSRNTLS